ncbi:MAG: AraD1 family protein [Chitinophagaceae bacterium]
MRFVQITHPDHGRKVALVREPSLVLLDHISSVYELAIETIQSGKDIKGIVEKNLSGSALDYDAVYNGADEWTLLPSFDCPKNVFSCLVSGTGLTHKNSALNRQMMHQAGGDNLTDSMKMYQWGLEGGQPTDGMIGTQPEWFYKGTGAILKAHNQTLSVPTYSSDGGEEPEVAGVYLIDNNSQPVRIGFTTGNEFSDHVMERKNYLYLAPSKLRNCAIGPELVIDMKFSDIEGTVKVIRDKKELWSADIHTGEKNMAHSLANLEYHHFKYSDHRQPGQAHIHFFGADAFSFGNGIKLETGDEMQVHWEGMGRALVNTIQVENGKEEFIKARSINHPE